MDPQQHWQSIYTTRPTTEVGWYEPDPVLSRRLVEQAVERGAESVVDVGGGASSLVDHLLELGLKRVAVVDISEAGLQVSQNRLGERASAVEWIIGDVTAIEDMGRFDVWHDRAVFHFLVDSNARRRYVALSERTIETGGTAIMATFAHDGPERCSGLPVHRYGLDTLAEECGPGWQLLDGEGHVHRTPLGVEQRFLYSTFRRVGRSD